MNKERIWILLSRKLSGEISIPEQQELDRLMDARDGTEPDLHAWSLIQDPAFAGLEDDEVLDAAGVYWEKQQEIIGEEIPVPKARWRKHRAVWLAAACIGLLIAAYAGLISRPPAASPENELHEFAMLRTGDNERKEFLLPDSSRVTLNENSVFTYDKDLTVHGNRSAHFSGEGYFEITHNPEAPFVIETAYMDIRVMGTTFNLLASQANPVAEATLFNGKIAVTLHKDQRNERVIILRPEEKLTLSTGIEKITPATQPEPETQWKHAVQYTVSEIAKPPEENIYRENAWVRGKVVFENDSLGMVAHYLEEKYGVTIVFDDPAVRTSRLRGVFRDESLQSILEALKFINAFNDFKIDGSTVTIY